MVRATRVVPLGGAIDWAGAGGNFLDSENVLYLDLGDVYMGKYFCKNSQSHTPRTSIFYTLDV